MWRVELGDCGLLVNQSGALANDNTFQFSLLRTERAQNNVKLNPQIYAKAAANNSYTH